MKSQPPDDKTEALSEDKLTWNQRATLRAIRHLYDLTTKNSSRRQASTSAFEALFLVHGFWASYASPGEHPDAEHSARDEIPVPRWIVDILEQGWARYLYAPKSSSFGEAFGLEGCGQGKQPANRERANYLRDINLARAVAELRNQPFQKGKPLSLEKARKLVAAKADCSEDIVRIAWRKYGRQMKAGLEAWGAKPREVVPLKTSL